MQANLNLTFEHCFECELKQVTPMLHFQADQHGATLRATQVKPMLDRFLCREYQREHNGEDVPKQWRMGKDDAKKDALRYKLTITMTKDPLRSDEKYRLLNEFYSMPYLTDKERNAIDQAISRLRTVYPGQDNPLKVPSSFFANMPPSAGDRRKQSEEERLQKTIERIDWVMCNVKELLLFFCEPLKLQVYCKEERLLEFLSKKLKDFFLLHSFGIRTSKGFGSFVINGTEESYVSKLYCQRYQGFIYADGRYPINHSNAYKAMNYASGILQLMKSGINHRPRNFDRSAKGNEDKYYIKGHLFCYFLGQDPSIGNEKNFIKNEVLQKKNVASKSSHRFVRALLGLADHIDFRHFPFDDTISFISEDGSIERFKAPVTVRIFEKRIYFLPESYPPNYLGKSFYILNKEQTATYNSPEYARDPEKREKYLRSINAPSLCIPTEFDLSAFLQDFVHEYEETLLKKVIEFRAYEGRNVSSFNNIAAFSDRPLVFQPAGGDKNA